MVQLVDLLDERFGTVLEFPIPFLETCDFVFGFVHGLARAAHGHLLSSDGFLERR